LLSPRNGRDRSRGLMLTGKGAIMPQASVTQQRLSAKELLDFGICVEGEKFEFYPTHCVTPTSLVLSYALAIAASGNAKRVLLAGFDGYPAGDPRNDETAEIFSAFQEHSDLELQSVTPTIHALKAVSVYGLL
ncbi:hypothetical protein ACFQXB_20210, partial [Plastorhodobacter daqingensis]